MKCALSVQKMELWRAAVSQERCDSRHSFIHGSARGTATLTRNLLEASELLIAEMMKDELHNPWLQSTNCGPNKLRTTDPGLARIHPDYENQIIEIIDD